MKKILSAMAFVIFAGIFNFCSANIVHMEMVRISDYNVHDFYTNFNRIARDVMTNNVFMNKYPEKIDGWSDNNYDVYVTACSLENEKGSPVVILYANKEGYVSYLKIVGVYGLVMNGTMTNLFTTIGLTFDEMKNLFHLLKNNDNVVTHSDSINRNIIVYIRDAKGVQAKEIEIIALKEK